MEIEDLLEKPYWVIDVLPKQVPPQSAGQFFAVERYWTSGSRLTNLLVRKLSVLLKLNCYYDLLVSADAGESWAINPEPGVLEDMMGGYLLALLPNEQALFTSNPDDLCITLYNPSDDLLDLVCRIAGSEGLFVWQPPQD